MYSKCIKTEKVIKNAHLDRIMQKSNYLRLLRIHQRVNGVQEGSVDATNNTLYTNRYSATGLSLNANDELVIEAYEVGNNRYICCIENEGTPI